MENSQRDLGSITKGGKKINRGSKRRERLTIMIFRKVGKVRTFKISFHLVAWAFVFFLFYIVATIFLVNKYFDVCRLSKTKEAKIAELSRELVKTTKGLERSMQHIALLDDYIKEKEEQGPKPMAPADYAESTQPKLVDIDELTVRRDRSTINVDFRIVNTQVNEEPIGGYIFVIARIKDSDKGEVWVYPSSLLKDGTPVNYRSGQRFFIQRFKSVSSKYTLSRLVNRTLILEILVYDRNGEIILKKIIEA